MIKQFWVHLWPTPYLPWQDLLQLSMAKSFPFISQLGFSSQTPCPLPICALTSSQLQTKKCYLFTTFKFTHTSNNLLPTLVANLHPPMFKISVVYYPCRSFIQHDWIWTAVGIKLLSKITSVNSIWLTNKATLCRLAKSFPNQNHQDAEIFCYRYL